MTKSVVNNMDNQQAFPRPIPGETGMTLRDYFAAKALQGIMAAANGTIKYKDLGEISYKAADAMLVERAKNTK